MILVQLHYLTNKLRRWSPRGLNWPSNLNQYFHTHLAGKGVYSIQGILASENL